MATRWAVVWPYLLGEREGRPQRAGRVGARRALLDCLQLHLGLLFASFPPPVYISAAVAPMDSSLLLTAVRDIKPSQDLS